MKFLKIFFIALVLCSNSSCYWAAYVDASLNYKSADFRASSCEKDKVDIRKLLLELGKEKTKSEWKVILKSIFSEQYWETKNSLNTNRIKLLFEDEKLIDIKDQDMINPNEKG